MAEKRETTRKPKIATLEPFVWKVSTIEVDHETLQIVQPFIDEIVWRIERLQAFQAEWEKDRDVVRKGQVEDFLECISHALQEGVEGLCIDLGECIAINFPACYEQYDRRHRDSSANYPKVGYQYLESVSRMVGTSEAQKAPGQFGILIDRQKIPVGLDFPIPLGKGNMAASE